MKPGNEELVKVGEHVTEGGSKIERFLNVSMNKYLSDWRRADAAAVAAVILFFGLLEIIFDAFFVFGDRQELTYQEFRGLDWRERFKFVVDVTKSQAKEAYEEMVRVQQRHRHVVSHGAPLFVVQHRGLGFIPADPLDDASPQTNPLYAFDADEVAATFATFDRTLAVFETHPTLWVAYKYVQTPLLLYLDDTSWTSTARLKEAPIDASSITLRSGWRYCCSTVNARPRIPDMVFDSRVAFGTSHTKVNVRSTSHSAAWWSIWSPKGWSSR